MAGAKVLAPRHMTAAIRTQAAISREQLRNCTTDAENAHADAGAGLEQHLIARAMSISLIDWAMRGTST